jgi:uncharacterized protein YpmB
MELLGRIAKWGVLPVLGIGSSAYGLVSVARDANSWGLPAWTWIAIGWFFFASVPILFAYNQWKNNKSLKAMEFYPDRAAMLEKRCLDTELRDEKVVRLWVAFESGSHYNTVNDKDVHKIEKMVLLHPECDLTKQFVEKLGDRVTSGRFAASIKDAARKAMGHRTLVRYSETPIMNVVIADPEDERADSWARVNVFLPHLTADRWPTFVIYRSKEPTLFGVIKDAYDEMWKDSKEPS